MFPGLLDTTCTISGMQPVANDPNGNEAMTQLYTNVPCHLEPLNTNSASSALLTEMRFSIGQAYNAYFLPTQDVKQGYQLVIGGNTYNVKLVQPFHGGPIGYILAMVELQES